ncbi:lipopolysaccharide biosynthesis protein [Nocardioides insulae]|uniref:lipopolysaccharide biosynthesis protein n=1 Tax=Nocardioides insulae TaxID=394734 RepID=UPI00048DB978|nr:lipopolysaccharide biosynthesis protein [Nocardioides insulae]
MSSATDEHRTDASRVRRLLRGSGLLAICVLVMNVSTYGFQIVAAHLLGPEEYGGVASLMSLLLVIGVFQLGLQATAARRISAAPHEVGPIERLVIAATYRTAVGLGALMLLLSPVVWHVLRLDSILPALLVAVAAVPLTVMGGQAGVLQGERRWGALAVLYLSVGVPRVVLGALFMVISPTESSAMLGVTVALFAPVLVGWWALRRDRATGPIPTGGFRSVLVEIAHGSVTLLAFFVLSNADIVIARNVLDAHNAGLYAAGLILTKAVMFLPQFVVVVAFPAMSTAGERRRALLTSMSAVLGLGLLSTVCAWLLSPVAMIFVGGDEYAGVEDRLWVFAVLGTALAMLQLLVYSVLGRQSRRSAYLIWAAVVAMVAWGSTADTLDTLVHRVVAIDLALLVVLLGLSLYRLRDDVPAQR